MVDEAETSDFIELCVPPKARLRIGGKRTGFVGSALGPGCQLLPEHAL